MTCLRRQDQTVQRAAIPDRFPTPHQNGSRTTDPMLVIHSQFFYCLIFISEVYLLPNTPGDWQPNGAHGVHAPSSARRLTRLEDESLRDNRKLSGAEERRPDAVDRKRYPHGPYLQEYTTQTKSLRNLKLLNTLPGSRCS